MHAVMMNQMQRRMGVGEPRGGKMVAVVPKVVEANTTGNNEGRATLTGRTWSPEHHGPV